MFCTIPVILAILHSLREADGSRISTEVYVDAYGRLLVDLNLSFGPQTVEVGTTYHHLVLKQEWLHNLQKTCNIVKNAAANFCQTVLRSNRLQTVPIEATLEETLRSEGTTGYILSGQTVKLSGAGQDSSVPIVVSVDNRLPPKHKGHLGISLQHRANQTDDERSYPLKLFRKHKGMAPIVAISLSLATRKGVLVFGSADREVGDDIVWSHTHKSNEPPPVILKWINIAGIQLNIQRALINTGSNLIGLPLDQYLIVVKQMGWKTEAHGKMTPPMTPCASRNENHMAIEITFDRRNLKTVRIDPKSYIIQRPSGRRGDMCQVLIAPISGQQRGEHVVILGVPFLYNRKLVFTDGVDSHPSQFEIIDKQSGI